MFRRGVACRKKLGVVETVFDGVALLASVSLVAGTPRCGVGLRAGVLFGAGVFVAAVSSA
jgi:hypothetical protein